MQCFALLYLLYCFQCIAVNLGLFNLEDAFFQRLIQAGAINGFQKVIYDTQPDSFFGIGKIIVATDNDNFRVRKKFQQFAAEGQPIHSIHMNIAQDNIRMFGQGGIERLFGA